MTLLGERKAPYLTLFVGGNHEASNYLRELYFGGWAAPNIYFLGLSGVVNLVKNGRKLRIGGVSGIFKDYDFGKNYEELPLNEETLRNAYHVRDYEIFKLSLVLYPIDWLNPIVQEEAGCFHLA